MNDLTPNPALQITVVDGIVFVDGEIDASTVAQLLAACESCPVGQPVRVDLSAVTFIDSSGLRTLLSVDRDAKQHGGGVVVRNPSRRVLRLFDVSGTTALFSIEHL
jgi:anti-sigma B factor antagonist